MTRARLEEAVVYFLQIAVEWLGEARVVDIVPAERELLPRNATRSMLKKAVDDLLGHRNDVEEQERIVRAAALTSKGHGLIAEFLNLPPGAKRTHAARAAGARLAAEANLFSVQLSAADAERVLLRAVCGKPRGTRARLRDELLRVVGLSPFKGSTVDHARAVLEKRKRKKQGAVKTEKHAQELHDHVPAHVMDIRRVVDGLLRRASKTRPGRF